MDEFLIHVYKNIDDLRDIFDNSKLKQILDYLNETLFMHFDLYKYVFTYEREAIEKNEEKQVSCPPPENFQSNKFSSAKPFHIWNYESKMREIENREKENNNNFLERRLKLNQEIELTKTNTKIEIDNSSVLNEECNCNSYFKQYN